MSGLHFSCADWMGDDKSANSLFDIIDGELEAFITEKEKPAWRKQFLVPYARQARARELKLKPEMMRVIIEPLKRYRDALVKKLGLPDPEADIEDWDAEDAEKLYCVRDLIRGNEVCQRTKKPIVVCFA
ncbi:MAG: hypothetical protein L0Z62_02905 [Gemmataceae bacterium]|nr:hypothetical protein [Gemmataceae bacterium]